MGLQSCPASVQKCIRTPHGRGTVFLKVGVPHQSRHLGRIFGFHDAGFESRGDLKVTRFSGTNPWCCVLWVVCFGFYVVFTMCENKIKNLAESILNPSANYSKSGRGASCLLVRPCSSVSRVPPRMLKPERALHF